MLHNVHVKYPRLRRTPYANTVQAQPKLKGLFRGRQKTRWIPRNNRLPLPSEGAASRTAPTLQRDTLTPRTLHSSARYSKKCATFTPLANRRVTAVSTPSYTPSHSSIVQKDGRFFLGGVHCTVSHYHTTTKVHQHTIRVLPGHLQQPPSPLGPPPKRL